MNFKPRSYARLFFLTFVGLFPVPLLVSSELTVPQPTVSPCKSYRFEKLSLPVLSSQLEEMSGLALGGLDANTLVHVQDSGNDPLLIYTRRDGSILASYTYADKNTDSEELARGDCPWGGSCIYVFDTGDNFHWRSHRSIWAIEEATLRSDRVHSEKIDFKFPNDEHVDVEAATLIGKTIYLFVKEPKHSRVFKLDTSAWKQGGGEAGFVTDLPYTMVTGASSSTDGKRILLLSWEGVVEMSAASPSVKASTGWYPDRRRIKIKSLAQQEAITFDGDQRSFLYSSEKKLFSNQEWGIMRAVCIPE